MGEHESFRDLLKTTAETVLVGSGVATRSSLPTERMYPIPRVAQSTSQAARSRFAQSISGSTITTPPGFYNPLTTPTAFQIPTNRKEEYLLAQWFYDNEPKVAAAIEFYTYFTLSGFKLECANSKVLDWFEEFCKRINFFKILPQIAMEYHLRGDVFPMASLDCQKCRGECIDLDTGDPCQHEGATWRAITLINAAQVEVTPTMLDMEPAYFLIPDDQMKKVVSEGRPVHIYNAIPERVRNYILQNEPIPLEALSIYHFKRGAAAWQPFGRSMVRRLFPTLFYKDKLRQAQNQVAERHILPIKIVKVGSDERPASDADLQQIQEQFANIANDPLALLVTHNNFDFDFYGASGKVLQLTNEMELIDQDILDGFMLNKAVLNGEGPNVQGAQVGILSMAQRLQSFRNEVKHWLEERIFRPLAMWNGFSVEGKRGEITYIYPTVKWDDLELRDNTGKLQIAMQLQQVGGISIQTIHELLDIDYDQEVERIRMEQASNMVNQPGLAAGMPGTGYGGGGAMGGMMPPAGMPGMDAGGMMPAPMMPPADAGGMGMPQMPAVPPPGPMASTDPDIAYRDAVSDINRYIRAVSAEFENSSLYRQASRGFINDAHRMFVESTMPVTGRAYAGALDDEIKPEWVLSEVGPPRGGPTATPWNAWAVQESFQNDAPDDQLERVAADNKQQAPLPMLFTKLEQTLYGIVLSLNMPMPFYAQYVAGPGMQYKLDGAFPTIKLGVEADSESFHAEPTQIERDRRRDAELASQGWTILRFTEDELNERVDEVKAVVLNQARQIMSRMRGG